MVNVTIVLALPPRNYDVFMRSSFKDSPYASSLSNDIASSVKLVSGFISRYGYYGMLTGSIILHNRTTTNKTYYYTAGSTIVTGTYTAMNFDNFAAASWSENIIYAIRVN